MWKCGNLKMWRCDEFAGSRHFELSPPEADEVRNLTESADINMEINHTIPMYLVPINSTRFLTSSASGGLSSK